jgi:anti-sigma factor RsiW
MKCRFSENDIALFVEGDIGPSRAREIEEHLTECRSCGELAEELRESQSVFKSLKQDVVSAAALASVRTRVLAEAGAGNARAGWGRWVYALAGAAFVAVVGVALSWQVREPAPQVTLNQVKVAPNPIASAPAPKTATTVKARVSVARLKGTAAKPQVGENAEIGAESVKPLVVKLLTDDPNIVIYWLVDQKNGGTL